MHVASTHNIWLLAEYANTINIAVLHKLTYGGTIADPEYVCIVVTQFESALHYVIY